METDAHAHQPAPEAYPAGRLGRAGHRFIH